MKEFFGRKILKYQDQIFRDLKTLVAIPSVADASAARRPFGERSAEALRWILNRARELGLDTVNVGDYAGHAEYGGGEAVAAVVTHVDVVPAGEGWTGDPYVLEKRGGRLYGRGTADDKGAAVVALYCLKALKDEKVKCVRKARAIFGAGEEIASDDLKQYFQREALPELAFTPDAEYGVCNREKGILHVELSAPADGPQRGSGFRQGGGAVYGGGVRSAGGPVEKNGREIFFPVVGRRFDRGMCRKSRPRHGAPERKKRRGPAGQAFFLLLRRGSAGRPVELCRSKNRARAGRKLPGDSPGGRGFRAADGEFRRGGAG